MSRPGGVGDRWPGRTARTAKPEPDLTRCYVCGLPFAGHSSPGHQPEFAPDYGVPKVFDTSRRQPTEAELNAWTRDDDAALLSQQRWEQAAMYLAEGESIRGAQSLLQDVGDNNRCDDLLAFGLMCVAAHRRLTIT